MMNECCVCGIKDGSVTMLCYCDGHDTDAEMMCRGCFASEAHIDDRCEEE